MFAKDKVYRFTPRAQQDLESIWLYTREHWSLTQADCYVSDILNACKGLASGEKIGVTAHTIRKDYWKYFVGSHAIYYKITNESIDIIRILHQSCDVHAHLT